MLPFFIYRFLLPSCFLFALFPRASLVQFMVKSQVAFVAAFGNFSFRYCFQNAATVFGLMGAFRVTAMPEMLLEFRKGKCQIILFHEKEMLKIKKGKTGRVGNVDGFGFL